MQSITININNNGTLSDKIYRFLESLKSDDLEIISKEDMNDLELIRATRNDPSIPFDEYIKNEDKYS